MTVDYQARVMIALSCFLLSFLCLAHSRNYYYGHSNYGSQGKPLEELYFYRTLRLSGGWDLGVSDFKMSMELRNQTTITDKQTQQKRNKEKQTNKQS